MLGPSWFIDDIYIAMQHMAIEFQILATQKRSGCIVFYGMGM